MSRRAGVLLNDAQVRRFARACGSIGWRADEDMHRGQQARQDARVPQGTCVRTSRRAVLTHVEDHCRSSKCSRTSLSTQPKGATLAPIVPSVAQQSPKVPKVCALLEMVPSHDSKQVRCAASTWSFENTASRIKIPRGLKRILLAFLDAGRAQCRPKWAGDHLAPFDVQPKGAILAPIVRSMATQQSPKVPKVCVIPEAGTPRGGTRKTRDSSTWCFDTTLIKHHTLVEL